MAYRCKRTGGECDGCLTCRPENPPETGVRIEATITLAFTVYGEIEQAYRRGDKNRAEEIAQDLIDDALDCCGLVGEDMTCEEFTMELNE